jgi:hypothetical protein
MLPPSPTISNRRFDERAPEAQHPLLPPGSAGVAHPQQTRFGQAIEMEDSERAGSRRRGGDGVAGHRLTGCTQHVEHRATPGVAE